jgi:hypothetical protein
MPEVKPDTDFKWPVGFEKVIAAPAQAVWQVISRRGNLEFCHPFCLRNPVHVWPGPQSRDEVHYLNGLVYARQFKEWFDGVGYDLEISGKGSNKSQVSWRYEVASPKSQELSRIRCKRSRVERYTG